MKKKKEVILLEELATLKQLEEEIQKNVYPLGITLSDDQFKQYKSWEERLDSDSQSDTPSKESDLSVFTLISEMYRTWTNHLEGKKSLMLDDYRLREKITNGEIFVNRFIDKDYQVKPVDYISESYGYDMDSPRIVFLNRAKPRRIFRKFDHYDPSKDNSSKGISLSLLSVRVINR